MPRKNGLFYNPNIDWDYTENLNSMYVDSRFCANGGYYNQSFYNKNVKYIRSANTDYNYTKWNTVATEEILWEGKSGSIGPFALHQNNDVTYSVYIHIHPVMNTAGGNYWTSLVDPPVITQEIRFQTYKAVASPVSVKIEHLFRIPISYGHPDGDGGYAIGKSMLELTVPVGYPTVSFLKIINDPADVAANINIVKLVKHTHR